MNYFEETEAEDVVFEPCEWKISSPAKAKHCKSLIEPQSAGEDRHIHGLREVAFIRRARFPT